jgi:hypothetical protein
VIVSVAECGVTAMMSGLNVTPRVDDSIGLTALTTVQWLLSLAPWNDCENGYKVYSESNGDCLYGELTTLEGFGLTSEAEAGTSYGEADYLGWYRRVPRGVRCDVR